MSAENIPESNNDHTNCCCACKERDAVNNGIGEAIKSRIPILQNFRKGNTTKTNRLYEVSKLIVCTVIAFILIWYMEEEAMKKPIDEGFQDVPIGMGPFPTVAIFPGPAFKAEVLKDIESLFHSDPRGSVEIMCGKFEPNERVFLAKIVGQLTAGNMESRSIHTFRSATKFLTSLKAHGQNLNQSSGNVVSNSTLNKTECFVQQGITSCDDLLKNCESEGQEANCSSLFKITVTEKGIGCLYNFLHYSAMDRNQSLRQILSEQIGETKTNHFKSVDMEQVTFAEGNDNDDFWHQSKSGFGNGISFTVKKLYEQQHTFDIVLANPRDPILYRTRKISLEFGKQHSISLDATADFGENSILTQPLGVRRCRFYAENNLSDYSGYTYARCHSAYVNKKRNCRFISDEGSPLGETRRPYCSPELWLDKTIRDNDENHRLFGFRECLKSCNDVEYTSALLPSEKLEVSESNNSVNSMDEYATVNIFFAKDDVTTRTKTLRGITAEALGIILGMIGFCHEITMPIIFDVIGIILKAIWEKVTKVLEKCRRRNRVQEIPASWFLQ